jgi:hypothetical protein
MTDLQVPVNRKLGKSSCQLYQWKVLHVPSYVTYQMINLLRGLGLNHTS